MVRVLHINDSDLPGRIFNGYDLHLALNERGFSSKQLVIDKYSAVDTVEELTVGDYERAYLTFMEEKYCVKSVLFPYAKQLRETTVFKEADIVHFHFPYHNMFSLLDYKDIMGKKTVWTIHDYWPLTGNCTNPLKCEKWMNGCGDCSRFDDSYFPMKKDNTKLMWDVKRVSYENINPHIVVATKRMERCVRNSPLTRHFTKIYRIPFGIKMTDAKKRTNARVVIGFRIDKSELKGCNYLFEAIKNLTEYNERIELQCVGNGSVPEGIAGRFDLIEHGWINDREKMMSIMSGWDIFVMPSLGESFGMMAIEAMSCGCALLCFKDTTVSEISNAPINALAADYADEKDLASKLRLLITDESLRKNYQQKGAEYVKEKYRFNDYVESHIRLYSEIMAGY